MRYLKWAPRTSFGKFPNDLPIDKRLSDGAKVLYMYLVTLRSTLEYSDKFICLALDISQSMLSRRKKELRDVGLICSKQDGIRKHKCFIGFYDCPADTVEAKLKEQEAKTNI